MRSSKAAPRARSRLPLVGMVLSSLGVVVFGLQQLTAQPATPKLTSEQQKKVDERGRLWHDAMRLRDEGKLEEASNILGRLIDIEYYVLKRSSPDGLLLLEAQAEIDVERGSFESAGAWLFTAYLLSEKLYGVNHWRTKDIQRAQEKVKRVAKRSDAERRRLAEANRLSREFASLHRQGKYAQALDRARRSAELRKELLGENDVDHAQSLHNMAAVLQLQGNTAVAESLLRRVLDIRKQAQGADHPDYASSLSNMAQLQRSQGKLDEALTLLNQARSIRIRALGAGHLDCASTCNSLAALHHARGDLASAEPLYREALEICKKAQSEQNPLTATCLANLAQLHLDQGDVAKASVLALQAMDIRRQVLPRDHPDQADGEHLLGLVFSGRRDYRRAEAMFQVALDSRRRSLGEEHPDYCETLGCLGSALYAQGKIDRAEALLRQSLEIQKRVRGSRQPAYATGLNQLGTIAQHRGEYAKAEAYYREALAVWQLITDDRIPEVAATLCNAMYVCWCQDKYAEAEAFGRRAVQSSRTFLEENGATLPERRQLAQMGRLRARLDGYLSLPDEARVDLATLYREVLGWKGAVSVWQELATRQRDDPELVGVFKERARVGAQLASLALTTPRADESQHQRKQMEELTELKERLENQLVQRSASFRRARQLARVALADLQTALPPDAVLIDLLEYTHFRPPPQKQGKPERELRLTAFVVSKGSIRRVNLGPADAVTRNVAQWRQVLQRRFALTDDHRIAADTRRLAWDPLAPHLRSAKLVLVSPDGALNRLPWWALPGDKPGSWLIEEMSVATLPVPRMLPDLLARVQASASPSLLTVGDVSFDADPGTGTVKSPAPGGGNDLNRWHALAATRAEVASVKKSFLRRHPQTAVTELTGSAATESTLCQKAPAHRFLHVATHGFFAPPSLRSALDPQTRHDDVETMELFHREGVSGFHPALLSGLVLAGANQSPVPGKDDGILTALEVQALDLRNVELATLSACETGLGEEAGGEGLLGLQRAFQVAGARSIVASLWQVDDAATQKLMTEFYKNLWEKKLPKLEALRQAQLWMLREGDGWMKKEGVSRGVADVRVPKERLAKEDGRLPPYYWAAFSLSGDWR